MLSVLRRHDSVAWLEEPIEIMGRVVLKGTRGPCTQVMAKLVIVTERNYLLPSGLKTIMQ